MRLASGRSSGADDSRQEMSSWTEDSGRGRQFAGRVGRCSPSTVGTADLNPSRWNLLRGCADQATSGAPSTSYDALRISIEETAGGWPTAASGPESTTTM
jgi:hypothetical protein